MPGSSRHAGVASSNWLSVSCRTSLPSGTKVRAGQIQGAIDSLVKRAIKSGDIRKDLEPFDLLRALIDVSNVASSPDWQQSARRLVDILIIIIGSRPIR